MDRLGPRRVNDLTKMVKVLFHNRRRKKDLEKIHRHAKYTIASDLEGTLGPTRPGRLLAVMGVRRAGAIAGTCNMLSI